MYGENVTSVMHGMSAVQMPVGQVRSVRDCEAKDNSPVDVQMGRIDSRISGLNELLHKLSAEIEPVLTPVLPSNASPGGPQPPAPSPQHSAMVDKLTQFASRIEELCDRARGLISRVEL